MIASLAGQVASANLDRIVVEVGGVGLLVLVPPATAASCRTGAPVHLFTSLVVREDSLTLYGFSTMAEREMFQQLQTVSGVGPRLALAMLSVLDPQTVRSAVATSDLATLTKIPGIGAKSAQRLVLELKDKLGPIDPGQSAVAAASTTGGSADRVQEALVGLGWNAKQAADAVTKVSESASTTSESELLRAALRELSR